MPKFKVSVVKIEQQFCHVEIEAENDLEAKSKAFEKVKNSSDLKWEEDEKTKYKAEICHY